MRQLVHIILCAIMMNQLKSIRQLLGLSQAKFAEILLMDTRSYADLERGVCCCSAVTLLLFLVFFCKDVQAFVDEMRQAILSVYEQSKDQPIEELYLSLCEQASINPSHTKRGKKRTHPTEPSHKNHHPLNE